MDDLISRAKRWHAQDPDEVTRTELAELIARLEAGDASVEKDLESRFSGPLEFGTAGLRGVIGAGESRMNRAVVLRTALGLGRYLLELDEAGARARGVVVGYDGRRLSREMAEDTSAVMATLGIPTFLSETVVPTPVTAYAVNHLGAAAGVMVTASHNPPEYNGYKVYWGNGAQIIPPHDKGIAASIEGAPPANEVPRLGLPEGRKEGLVRDLPAEVTEAYLAKVRALSVHPVSGGGGGDRDAAIVYTPLHGVGDILVHAALAAAGFTNVTSVAEQAKPDGEFPTVAFPNPEEKGALDLAYALADEKGADIILASDPDVDRLAVAVRSPKGTEGGKWAQLTGNQVGVLLGHDLLTHTTGLDRCILASCVSSPELGGIAEAMGVHYEETLTGFKWIANRALQLKEERGLRMTFGYEEALGYSVGELVRDKDGISAAVAMAELWAGLRAEGKTLFDQLDAIARQYGLWVSGQVSVTLPGKEGLDRIRAIMKSLRDDPPKAIGPLAVVGRADALVGKKWLSEVESVLPLPPSDVLFYQLEGGSRIVARPSGTEPKIKLYVDVREGVAEGEAIGIVRQRALARLGELKAAVSERVGV
jgi:phosphomannomutase